VNAFNNKVLWRYYKASLLKIRARALCANNAHTVIRRRADVRQWEKGKLSEHGKVSLDSEQTLTFVSDNFGVIFQLVRRRVIIICNFWGARLTLKDEWTTVGVFGCPRFDWGEHARVLRPY
jgi:hypothetical protein